MNRERNISHQTAAGEILGSICNKESMTVHSYSKRIIQDLQSPSSPSSLSIWMSNGENNRILFIASDQCSAYVSALRHASLYLCQGMLRNLRKVIQNHTYFMIYHKIYALLKCLLLSIVWVMNLRPKYPVWSLGQCRIPKLWISDKRRTILGKLPREDFKKQTVKG